MSDDHKPQLRKWLETQRPGTITIDDAVDGIGKERRNVAAALVQISREAPWGGNTLTKQEKTRGAYTLTRQRNQEPTPLFAVPAPEGRRLTPEEEKTGLYLYAAGASEREVAEALSCSASTAHRLRERLEDRIKKLDTVKPFLRPIIDLVESGSRVTISDGKRSVTIARAKGETGAVPLMSANE